MSEQKQMSFLQHLDELRWRLVRIAIAVICVGVVIWIFQEWIMNHLFLSLKDKDFISFKLMCKYLNVCVEDTSVKMQSMTMSGQFNYAMTMCIMGGIIVSSPYIFYQIWAFVKPGLKQNELKAAKGLVFFVSLCFITGILFGYFVVAPLTVQFFSSFQISSSIENNFTISSYMGTVISTVFYTGLLFLLPIASFILAKIGLIDAAFLKKYRRHAIVVILILAAVITPPDILSQIIVSIPIIGLYEIGILVAKRAGKKE
ncbi:MAG: twin-arginine translocase subunit TatC [Flavobacteriia bacterium]|nr:twin-arginine translocase subunit TatC [Flavobacteriia bacterium]